MKLPFITKKQLNQKTQKFETKNIKEKRKYKIDQRNLPCNEVFF